MDRVIGRCSVATASTRGKFVVDVRVKILQDLPRVPVDLQAGVKAARPVHGFRYKSGDPSLNCT